MKYRILTALLLAAVLIACYMAFGDGWTSTSPASQSQSAPTDNPLKGFKVP